MEPTATVLSSSANLLKTIVGAGVLAVPYAFRNDGILVGSLLILLAAVTSAFGLFVLGKCSKTLINPRNSSFFTFCMLTYPSLSPLFDLAMFIQCFGVGLSYLVLIGDIFPGLFGGTREYWILGSALLIVPLCTLRKLDSLRYSSILGLFALGYISLLVLSIFVYDVILTDNYKAFRGDVYWFKVYDYSGLLSTFSIIIFAFTGSMNLCSIINELEDNSLSNISTVIGWSLSIATTLFMAIGITGYLTFGSNVSGNIILNYDADSPWVFLGKLCLGTMVILSFPLLFHPCRISVNNMIVWGKLKFEKQPHSELNTRSSEIPIRLSIQDDDNESLASDQTHESHEAVVSVENNTSITHDVPFPQRRFYVSTAILLFVMFFLSLRVTSFALVLSLVGATGSTSISFTLPGLFGYKLIGTDSLAVGQMVSPKDRFYRGCSALLVWFGLAVTFFSLYVIFFHGNN
ncbi:hypothetical protein HG535_0D01950 [Zygotorulaspora mrakii]|uniref:Amino acid transporter transmembrane domain-containing protein n=1 Tax=Zygotorulaspora mrakii TaxID=42260 RepID=A0A7H9B1W9_ZYGMR|nr:uncharacterized protein HG535_0D01950 [Zygotorulaspora mrakii]QLG72487.1 hypothetical protein HG535_0D01950 [Zygotorulaspora mrakii]